MDIRINDEKMAFKFRVNSIIVKNGKVLLVTMNHNNHLCCSGGHVHIGERTDEAIIRETMEEVELKPTSCRLIAIIENFFTQQATGKKFHELSYYYIMDIDKIPPEKMKDYSFLEHDEDKLVDLKFQWIPLNKLDDYNIKPIALKEILKHLDANLIQFVVADEKIIEEKIL